MPTIPALKATTNLYTSVGIINSILRDPTLTELQGIPLATATTDSIRMIGQQITGFAPRMNQFRDALVNRIGMVKISYMLFNNPLGWAKKGKLEMGETVEQIWLGLAQAFPYDPVEAEENFPKQAPPEVSTAFHSINYQEVYKITVNEYQLQRAFLSLEGMRDFIESIIGSIVRAVTYDEFSMTKYLMATLLLAGKIKTQTIPAVTAATADEVITEVATLTNGFQFASTQWTMAGNENTTSIDDTYVLESTRANALIKVNALASAYNVDYVKFSGHVVMFDSLATYPWKRLDKIMSKDPGYRRFTEAELAVLETVDIIVMDRQFLQIYDSVEFMATPFINGEGAYTNYPYHVSKIFSASPFHNCVAFTTATSGITSVTVTPATATVVKGTSIAMQAVVANTGFADASVTWSISAATASNIGQDGILRVGASETATTITVSATSNFDATKKGTATITIAAPPAK